MRATLLAIAAAAALLTGCELRAEIAVNEDGSGTVGMVFAVEPEMLRLFGPQGSGADPFAELRADLADDPVAWRVEEFSEGALTGIRATFAFAALSDLTDKLAALGGDDGSGGRLEGIHIERRGAGWAFEGTSGDHRAQLSAGVIPLPVEQIADLVRVQFRVTLPGAAGEHNADEVSSAAGATTFVWQPDLEAGAVALRAETSPGAPASPVLPVALGMLAVVAAALAWLGIRRPGRGPAVADPDGTGEVEAEGERAEAEDVSLSH